MENIFSAYEPLKRYFFVKNRLFSCIFIVNIIFEVRINICVKGIFKIMGVFNIFLSWNGMNNLSCAYLNVIGKFWGQYRADEGTRIYNIKKYNNVKQ